MLPAQNSEKLKQKNCEFIDKLMDMMEKYPNCFQWGECGNQLIVNNLQQVQHKVLQQYFRHSNFASFVRQLNMYGFCKKEKCQEFLKFSHKIFRKGNNQNFHLIQRKAKIRNIKNCSERFYESNNKLIEQIKTKSGLNSEAQQLTLTLINYKQSIQDAIKKIRSQLDKLIPQIKDTRSKNVIQTFNIIRYQSIKQINASLGKAKQIDELISKKFNKESQQKIKDNKARNNYYNQIDENECDQCSLQNQLEEQEMNKENNRQEDDKDEQELEQEEEMSKKMNEEQSYQESEQEYSHRFQVGQLSAFNQFHNSQQ